MGLNKAMHSEQFSVTCFMFDRYANTKKSTTNYRVMAALELRKRMDDRIIYEYPSTLNSIIEGTKKLGFDMASEPKTGALLKALAASKPHGKFLEIGTGTGLSAAWILQGMDNQSTLISVDNDDKAQRVALGNLGDDSRFTFICADGGAWLEQNQGEC
jgi:predicted O-methyltransferase YrrM